MINTLVKFPLVSPKTSSQTMIKRMKEDYSMKMNIRRREFLLVNGLNPMKIRMEVNLNKRKLNWS